MKLSCLLFCLLVLGTTVTAQVGAPARIPSEPTPPTPPTPVPLPRSPVGNSNADPPVPIQASRQAIMLEPKYRPPQCNKDTDDNCYRWSLAGECAENTIFMQKYCQSSCGMFDIFTSSSSLPVGYVKADCRGRVCTADEAEKSGCDAASTRALGALPRRPEDPYSWCWNDGVSVGCADIENVEMSLLPVEDVRSDVSGEADSGEMISAGTTPPTPKPCAEDLDLYCDYWQKNGYPCESEWSKSNCATSCCATAAVPAPTTCAEDLDPTCYYWQNNGYPCESEWSKSNCATSCCADTASGSSGESLEGMTDDEAQQATGTESEIRYVTINTFTATYKLPAKPTQTTGKASKSKTPADRPPKPSESSANKTPVSKDPSGAPGGR